MKKLLVKIDMPVSVTIKIIQIYCILLTYYILDILYNIKEDGIMKKALL